MEMVHFIPPGQRRLVMLAAQSDAPVLIRGSSGTGKGAIAKWVHDHGPRASKAYIIASRDLSLFEQLIAAQGGTLVIPEVGDRPLAEQKVLLGYLSTKSVPHPKNPDTPMLLNVRIIVTTTQSLDHRAQGGLFNAELLKKLNVFRFEMPDLSNRNEEFEDIAFGLLREITHELRKDHIRDFDESGWKSLKAYTWPGNLRELRNVIRMAVVRCQGDLVTEGDLPDFHEDRVDFRATREEFEKIYLQELLKTFRGNLSEASRVSRLSRETLESKLKHFGLPFRQEDEIVRGPETTL